MLLGRNIRRSCFGLLTRYQLPIWSDIVYSEIMGWIFPIFMFSGRWNSLQWGEELRQWHSDGPRVTRLHKRVWLKSVLGRLKDKFCLSTESCLRSNFKSCYHGHFSEEKLTNEAICWLKKCSTNRNRSFVGAIMQLSIFFPPARLWYPPQRSCEGENIKTIHDGFPLR